VASPASPGAAHRERAAVTTLLLIHAFPVDAEMWEPQTAALEGDTQVLAPSLPGFGDSPSAGEVMSMEAAADFLADELDRAGDAAREGDCVRRLLFAVDPAGQLDDAVADRADVHRTLGEYRVVLIGAEDALLEVFLSHRLEVVRRRRVRRSPGPAGSRSIRSARGRATRTGASVPSSRDHGCTRFCPSLKKRRCTNWGPMVSLK
jgi:hypothetical protein